MKKLMITTALVAGLISLGYSQNKPDKVMKTPEERAQLSSEAIGKRLNLTADQKTEVYALNLEQVKKMDEMRSSENAFRKSHSEKRKTLMADADTKLNKILTVEQQKSYGEMKASKMGEMKKHPKHPGGKSRIK